MAAQCDILLLAESWKEKWTGTEIKLLNSMGKCVVSQAATRKNKVGRPSKGAIWIISKNIKEKMKINFNFISNRITTCTIGDITVVEIYMPSDNTKESTYDVELSQLERKMDTYKNYVVMGDFNGDVNRSYNYKEFQIMDRSERRVANAGQKDYRNDKLLAKWLEVHSNYVILTKQFTPLVPYTFLNTMGHLSCIDHIIANSNNLSIRNVNVIVDEDEISDLNQRYAVNHKGIHKNSWPGLSTGDHRAIEIELDIGGVVESNKIGEVNRKLDWNNTEHKNEYMKNIGIMLMDKK